MAVFLPGYLSYGGVTVPDLSTKFGKITDYELSMPRYEADTSAHAVVLNETNIIRYFFDAKLGFRIETTYEVKIKVFDKEGTSWGDIEIPYYSNGIGNSEIVSRISASSYNLENGKQVEKKLSRKDIHKEEISDKYYNLKFSIPEVKEGSVIEYRYVFTSDFEYDIPTIKFQYSIPIINKYAEVYIPEFYTFALNVKGHENISTERFTREKSVVLYGQHTDYTEQVYKFTGENIPALRNEPFVWCKNDFVTAVEFELSMISFPGSKRRIFSNTWADVNESLGRSSSFSTALNLSNPFVTEVDAIISDNPTEAEKISAIHKLVMSRIVWNNTWSLYPKNIKEVLKLGTGSSGDINSVLMSALRHAGFRVTPILLNPRNYGRLPMSSPSLDKINAFIIMVTLADGSNIFLDGTDKGSDINMIREVLMVDRARIYGVDDHTGWVDLTKIANHNVRVSLSGGINGEGVFSGDIVYRYQNAPALGIKRKYRDAKSEDEYIEELEKRLDITITEYSISGIDSNTVTEKIKFTYGTPLADERFYMYSTVLPYMVDNIFSVKDRFMPVEFSYPYRYQQNTRIELPEGFAIEELPEDVAYHNGDGNIKYSLKFQAVEGAVSSMVVFDRTATIFPVDEFDALYSFYGTVAGANQRRIVIRKL